MIQGQRLDRSSRWIEWLLAFVVAGGMIYTMIFLYRNGYLPQPYFWDPNDTWMDWFNTADWARDRGTYDSWGAIYPPLTFVIMKLIGISSCYQGGSGAGTSFYARDCDWVGVIAIHSIYLINIVLIAVTYFKLDRRTALPRAIALSMSLPLTHALERGNIILLALTFFILALGPILTSARLKWIALGLSINLKIYLAAALFSYLLSRKWRWFEGGALATAGIYLATYYLYGSGSPVEIFNNLASFQSGQDNFSSFLDIWFAATYIPMLAVLNNPYVAIESMLGSTLVSVMINIATWSQRITQIAVLISLVAIWLRPEALTRHRCLTLVLALALISSEPNGYTQMFVIFLTFFESWKGVGARWAIIAAYLLSIQFDFHIDQVVTALRTTYFSGENKVITYYLTLGPFIRPAIFYSIPFALACATIRTVWIDIREQGWRDRWRFRHDLPIMVGKGKARRPA